MPTRSVDIETFAANSGISLSAGHGVPLDPPLAASRTDLENPQNVVDLSSAAGAPLDTPAAVGIQLDESAGTTELRSSEGIPLESPTENERKLTLGNVEEQQ